MKKSSKTLSSKERVIALMRYLGIDRWSTKDYSISCKVFKSLEENPLPEQIKRDAQEISFHYYGSHKEDGKIIYHGQKSWGKWDERDHMWVVIEEPKLVDAILNAVISVLEKRAFYKAEKEAFNKMKIDIIKKELENKGLGFLDGVEDYVINEKDKRK